MEGRVKILKIGFRVFADYYSDCLEQKCDVLVTTLYNLNIVTVLHWRPPGVHSFGTDPSVDNTAILWVLMLVLLVLWANTLFV